MYRRLCPRGSGWRTRSACIAGLLTALTACPHVETPEPPAHQVLVQGDRRAPDLNSVSFLEALLAAGEVRSIPEHLLPWGGPTLSALWPPSDPRAQQLAADLDSTAWHFKLNRMRIPSAVTNRFLSEAPLSEPYATACVPPACAPNRIPRLYAGGEEVDLLATINFVTGLDETDALNGQVGRAVRALRSAVELSAVSWSVEPLEARDALLRVYAGGGAASPVSVFRYRRRLPDGTVLEVRNSRVAEHLSQSTSSSSSN